ncbi:MAG: transketolase, partial [Chloroflexi bacterium]|nr:transketolase [Chloroflexota bacterium]
RSLQGKGIVARVVSMPSWELFEAQNSDYREQVLPLDVRARVSLEAASSMGWDRYVGLDGAAIGIDRFGASAPYKEIYQHFGITAEHVARKAERVLEKIAASRG